MQLLLLNVSAALADDVRRSADVAEASSSRAALATLARFQADAAVIDIAAAGAQTPAFLNTLRHPARTPRANLPVIALIDVSTPQEVGRLVRVGIDYPMVKPLTAVTLLRFVTQIVGERPAPIATQSYVGPDRRRLDAGGFAGGVDRRQAVGC